MIRKLNWQGHTSTGRQNAIEQIKQVISSCGGSIMNFNVFSDLAMALSIEIEENEIPGLYDSLGKYLILSEFDPSVIKLDSQREWYIFLNISFSSGKGNLKTEIPEVPG